MYVPDQDDPKIRMNQGLPDNNPEPLSQLNPIDLQSARDLNVSNIDPALIDDWTFLQELEEFQTEIEDKITELNTNINSKLMPNMTADLEEAFAFGEEQLLKLAEEWEAMPELV